MAFRARKVFGSFEKRTPSHFSKVVFVVGMSYSTAICPNVQKDMPFKRESM